MTNLKQEAQEYVPKKTLNIADLDRVDLTWNMEDRQGTSIKQDEEGKDVEENYTYKVMIVNDIEYRVPNSVLEAIQDMLEIKSDIKFIKVEKTGSGFGTKYKVKKVE